MLKNVPIPCSLSLYSLSFSEDQKEWWLLFSSTRLPITTKHYPATLTIVTREIPTILKAWCDNEQHLPFREEVKSTELGHLFEHILLEYLCLEELGSGSEEALFEGRTSWNWVKEPQGTYHIRIGHHHGAEKCFHPAVEKTIKTFNHIVLSEKASYLVH